MGRNNGANGGNISGKILEFITKASQLKCDILNKKEEKGYELSLKEKRIFKSRKYELKNLLEDIKVDNIVFFFNHLEEFIVQLEEIYNSIIW